MNAASTHNVYFWQLLLEKDPHSLNVTDDQVANALWFAVFTNNVEGLVLLLQQPSVGSTAASAWTRRLPWFMPCMVDLEIKMLYRPS